MKSHHSCSLENTTLSHMLVFIFIFFLLLLLLLLLVVVVVVVAAVAAAISVSIIIIIIIINLTQWLRQFSNFYTACKYCQLDLDIQCILYVAMCNTHI